MLSMTIDGRDAPTQSRFDVINPATGTVYETAPDCTCEQLDAAMAAAARALPAWRADEEFRRAKLREFSAAMMDHTPEIAEILARENGKTMDIGGMEGMIAATWLDYYSELETSTEVVRDDEDAHVEVVRNPLGVVAAIAAWNMPVGLAFFKIAPALRAGNTMVLKPSPYTPLSTLRIGEIARAILPPGVLNVVSGGDDLGAWMTSHPVPRKISFTGSVQTGKAIAASAASDLKRCTLELGGNDAAILLDDVDIPTIAEGLFWTAFFNNGQGCALVKRVYAPRSIHADVVEALAEVARSVTVGDPLDEASQLGPLSTRPQFDRVCELVTDAVAHGATAATGGKPLDHPGFFFEPTILTGIADGVRLVDEEQFGPALPVIPYDDVDDAVVAANATSYGLGGSVWSEDIERATRIARTLDVGSSWVNTHCALGTNMPFGGHKWSGMGVENGPWGLDGFTEIQVVYTNRGVPAPGAL